MNVTVSRSLGPRSLVAARMLSFCVPCGTYSVVTASAAAPSRNSIEQYQAYEFRVRSLAERINGRFANRRAPAIVLLAGDEKADTRIRVLGAPAGYDFMSLVDAILVVSDASPQRL